MNYYRFDLSPLMGNTTLTERDIDLKFNTRKEMYADAFVLCRICDEADLRRSIMRFGDKILFGFTLSSTDYLGEGRTDCWFYGAMEEDYLPFRETEEGKRLREEARAMVAEFERKRKEALR